MDAHIVFLQETHLRARDQARLWIGWVGQVYNSSSLGKIKGAAILLYKSIPCVHSKVISDPNGWFVIVAGQVYNINIVLANVYAPKWDDDAFFRCLYSKLPDLSSYYLIIGETLIRGLIRSWIVLPPRCVHCPNLPK